VELWERAEQRREVVAERPARAGRAERAPAQPQREAEVPLEPGVLVERVEEPPAQGQAAELAQGWAAEAARGRAAELARAVTVR
jgi:hypothetical protein